MKKSRTTKLSLAEMRQVVLQEMDHIPRWPREQQSELRMSYWLRRMNSLGRKAELPDDRSAVLKKCLEEAAERHPGVEFQYDRAFFGDCAVERNKS